MDQERIGIKIADVYKLTGELVLKSMYYAMEHSASQLKNFRESKTYSGEVNWNKFLETRETKHFETFMTSEVNSERLTEYLKGYDIGFSIKDNGDGTSIIAIDAKNIKALEASFKGVINDLTDSQKSQKLQERLVKTPKNMSVKEKLTYYKKQVKSEIAKKSKVKEKGTKIKAKGEKEL
ncbi:MULTISPECIES: hypothetical protein [Streptococcaceae]|uniref:Conserved domain protein n=2 Tax=Streptococcus parauberis TaxID=1348 RepID=F1YYY2_9STRE|nr:MULTISPECIES: hypothetical protein [Streptococcaceae]AUT05852.1 hypothetical protein SPSF3K_01127 [Streptococcus parauberis]EGE53691.1 conserved domain protein [Streptococcus parauberis NCFD 2020]EMF49664.1 hypothetical protein SPJ2_0484 [Streptococcus parauberis KRS-02109]EMG26058.1 hypothetical protein SPJ1_0020 [Streptococcus parauberis KRS-02083]PNY19251.1 hypothetical protein ASN86_01112 [Streptococcus parauberis]